MCDIIIFGGTTEGRLISEYAAEKKLHVYVSVTTDYGERLLPKSEYLHILGNKMNLKEMQEFFQYHNIKIVIDATHPFATEVTKNIKAATDSLGLKNYRVVRADVCEESRTLNESKRADESEKTEKSATAENRQQQTADSLAGVPTKDLIWFDTLQDIIDYLNIHQGNIFVTTGSKELRKIAEIRDADKRCAVRILDIEKLISECMEMGFDRQRIIAKRGPFCFEENLEDFKKFDCRYLITKESGNEGGFFSKLEAAAKLKMTVLALKRPKEQGIGLREMLEILDNIEKEIHIIGIGMDGKDTITVKGKEIIEDSELVIGAKRMIQSVGTEEREVFVSYNSDEIADYIRHTDKKKIAVLMSGDCGFYSGCRNLIEKLSEMKVRIVSGISSVAYFAGAIKESWQDMNFVSLHGVESNIITEVRSHRKTFFVLGGDVSADDICQRLVKYQYEHAKVYIGEKLGMKEERILSGEAGSLIDVKTDRLSVMLVVNDTPIDNPMSGISNELFVRGKVPMTKSEVRAVVMSKLRVGKNDICWDIGCGTGSVSVEMAGFAVKGRVYAVDKNADAIALTNKNAYKFGCDNIVTIHSDAKEGAETLPAPDVVFIGGGSDNLAFIIDTALKKNDRCRFVVTAVTIETLGIVNELQKKYNLNTEQVQVSITRTTQVGEHTMLKGENPIFVIRICNRKQNE